MDMSEVEEQVEWSETDRYGEGHCKMLVVGE